VAKSKTQSPVVDQVIQAYALAMKEAGIMPEDAQGRLVDVLLGDNVPTPKRVEDALFPEKDEEVDP
jgi:hypothetical protein